MNHTHREGVVLELEKASHVEREGRVGKMKKKNSINLRKKETHYMILNEA